jgi:hypothetical protein
MISSPPANGSSPSKGRFLQKSGNENPVLDFATRLSSVATQVRKERLQLQKIPTNGSFISGLVINN